MGLIKKRGGYCEDLRAEVWGTKSWGVTKYLCRTILFHPVGGIRPTISPKHKTPF